ncbi:FAD/NAD(P)-binding domain-containing protein [Phlegmacium glaucopus]|nr:FAD/NAD(P)-binding domain-containing protein [Phlegmacium glaucopus]
MGHSEILQEPVGIIGAGVAGLINAHVLLQDGFSDVTLITRDEAVGGTWARNRVYPGLHINNVHGEYRLSPLDMPPPENGSDRLSGFDLCNYMEKFSKDFLVGKAKFHFETEVLNIERDGSGKWNIAVEDIPTKSLKTLTFSRIILATGGCSNPRVPAAISPSAAEKVHFRGLVVHSSEFGSHLDKILETVKPTSPNSSQDDGETVLVVGGGKSSKDMAGQLTREGRKVAIVFASTNAFLASNNRTPSVIRKGRLLSVFMPYFTLNTRLEQFLHTTTVGSVITKFFWRTMTERAYKAFNIPKDSPLRLAPSIFWTVRTGDEGCASATNFHGLATSGKIEVIAPARLVGYADDGRSVILSNGRVMPVKCVLLGTGYQSSWANIFPKKMAEEIGIDKHISEKKITPTWNYKTLEDSPALQPENEKWITSIYRGIIPAKNIERRDFAIAGATFTANPGYSFEVAAHWISSYFQNDKMRIPSSAEEAIADAELRSAWMKARYPNMAAWANESYSGNLDLWTWPQAADELLEDMQLPTLRSGGNWYNWLFKVIDLKEISTLGEERQARRIKSH